MRSEMGILGYKSKKQKIIEEQQSQISKLERELNTFKNQKHLGEQLQKVLADGREYQKFSRLYLCLDQGVRILIDVCSRKEDLTSAIVSYFIEESSHEYLRALINCEETIKSAMIENLSNISSKLKYYCYENRGFVNALDELEKSFADVKFDVSSLSKDDANRIRMHQTYLKIFRDTTGILLSPYYFVEPSDRTIHRAN